MSVSKWWTWDWDRTHTTGDASIRYHAVTRWRRGWVTLYRLAGEGYVDWQLWLPFNVSVGIQVSE